MSSTNDSKLITLDHIQHIKDYVDNHGTTLQTTIEDRLAGMDAATKQHLQEELEKANNAITEAYEKKYNALKNELSEAIANGNTDLQTQLRLQLDALKSYEEESKKALAGLNDLINGVKASVFGAGEINDLIRTAMITSVEITDESILTPEIFAGKVVALIANFGRIKADHIEAGAIVGHTIANHGGDWQLDDDGSGWLADHNIEWDKNGNVTFGPNVKLTWSAVDGKEDGVAKILEDLESGRLSVEELIDLWLSDGNINFAEIQQMKYLLDQISKEYNTITNSVYTMIDKLENIKITVPEIETFEDELTNPELNVPELDDSEIEEEEEEVEVEETIEPIDTETDAEVEAEALEEDYSTYPWGGMSMKVTGSKGFTVPYNGGTYYHNIEIEGISYNDYINNYVPKHGHYVTISSVKNIDAKDITLYVKNSPDIGLYYHVVFKVSETALDRNISFAIGNNVPTDSEYYQQEIIYITQFANSAAPIEPNLALPAVAANTDIEVECDGVFKTFDINIGGLTREEVLSRLAIKPLAAWINIVSTNYINNKVVVTYEVSVNDTLDTRVGQILIEYNNDADGTGIPVYTTLETINIVQHGYITVDVDTQAAVDALKNEIADHIGSLNTKLDEYIGAAEEFAFDRDENSETDLISIIAAWASLSDNGADSNGVLKISDTDRAAIKAAATAYNEKYVNLVEAYNDSVSFLAEITGRISDLKINNVRKTLSNLADDYLKLKDITNETFVISEAYINAIADDGLLSPTEITSLKQKYEEIAAEYIAITENVNTIIDVYNDATQGEQTNVFNDEENKVFYDQLCAYFTSYKDEYERVAAIFNYYTSNDAEKDAFGNVKIVEGYDIDSIPEFYKTRQRLLDAYYTANSFYTTYNRFGSKLTHIGNDGIYSGTIMADNLRGWCIQGLTVQSGENVLLPKGTKWYKYNKDASNENEAFTEMISDGEDLSLSAGPAWQIDKDGTGYLAGGKFKWTKTEATLGNVTIKLGDDVTNLEDILNDINTVRNNVSKFADDGIIGVAEQWNMITLFNDIVSNTNTMVSSLNDIRTKLSNALNVVSDETNKNGISAQITSIDNASTSFNTGVSLALGVIEYYTGIKDKDYPATKKDITVTPKEVNDNYDVAHISNYYTYLEKAKTAYNNAVLYYTEELSSIIENSVTNKMDELKETLNTTLSQTIADMTADNVLTPAELTTLELIKNSIDADYSDICNKITALKVLFFNFVTKHNLADETIVSSINGHINSLDTYLSELADVYNPVVELLQYYNNCEQDEYGNIKLNDSYNLSDINSYYTKKTDIANEYNKLYETYTIYVDTDVRDNIDNLTSNVDTLQNTIDNIFADNCVSPAEQNELRRTIDKINGEKRSVDTIWTNVCAKLSEVKNIISTGSDADKDANLNKINSYIDSLKYSENTTEVTNSKYHTFNTAYNNVCICLAYYTKTGDFKNHNYENATTTGNIEINPSYNLNGSLADYYSAFDVLKELLNEVATFCASYTVSNNKVSDLEDKIKNITEQLGDIASDNQVDESERRTLSMIKASIVSEYQTTCNAVDEIRIKFGNKYPAALADLSTLYTNEGQYNTAYTNAIDVITYYEAAKDIISSKPLSHVSDYYTAYNAVCKSIQECNLLYADLVAKDAENNANNKIQEALNRINTLDNSIKALSGMLDESSGGVIDWINKWSNDNTLNSQEIKDLQTKYAEYNGEYDTIINTVNSTLNALNAANTASGGLNSDTISEYISGIATKLDVFTTSYAKLTAMYEYYMNAWKEVIAKNDSGNDIENGTIPAETVTDMFVNLNPDYPIADTFKVYNGTKTDLVNYHNEAATFITSYHRFGSKLTHIGEDGIYSGRITGDQIEGARISGTTFQSAEPCTLPSGIEFRQFPTASNGNITDVEGTLVTSNGNTQGPAWQIDKTGNGYLANGQISWKGSTVTLGDNVKISWGNVDGSADIENDIKAIDDSVKYTAEMAAAAQAAAQAAKDSIPTPERITEITKNAITTETITGTLIKGKTIESEDGKWQLDKDGSGFLANGNIEWTAGGKVTFGPDVELSWKSIKDAPTISQGDGGMTAAQVDQLITTKISATGITTDTFTGKTIQSVDTGKYWKIDRDGAGHLAQNNISWDAKGNLTVKGKINGEIGVTTKGTSESTEDVTVRGNLIVKGSGTETVSALPGNYVHPESFIDAEGSPTNVNTGNPNIVSGTENRKIVYAAGVPNINTVYRWIHDGGPMNIIPTMLYTLNNYILSGDNDETFGNKPTIYIQDVYYNTEGDAASTTRNMYKMFGDICINRMIRTEGTNEYTNANISNIQMIVNVDGIKHIYRPYTTGGTTAYAVKVADKVGLLSAAETKIYSDGTIETETLNASSGHFGGTIDSDGTFRGELKNVSGTIDNAYIINTNLTIGSHNQLLAKTSKSVTYKDTDGKETTETTPHTLFMVDPAYEFSNSSSASKTVYVPNVSGSGQYTHDKSDKKNDKTYTYSHKICKLAVTAGCKVTTPKLKVTCRLYQPRRADGIKYRPVINKIYWKYENDSDENKLTLLPDGSSIANGTYTYTTSNATNSTYKGCRYDWVQTFSLQDIDAAKITKNANIVFYVQTTCKLTKRQIWDYAACHFNFEFIDSADSTNTKIGGFLLEKTDPESSSSLNVVEPNRTIIAKNGVMIKTVAGHELYTGGNGDIKISAGNGKHALLLNSDGIFVYGHEVWGPAGEKTSGWIDLISILNNRCGIQNDDVKQFPTLTGDSTLTNGSSGSGSSGSGSSGSGSSGGDYKDLEILPALGNFRGEKVPIDTGFGFQVAVKDQVQIF